MERVDGGSGDPGVERVDGDSGDPGVERVDQASSRNQPPPETSSQPRMPPAPMSPSGLAWGYRPVQSLPTRRQPRQ